MEAKEKIPQQTIIRNVRSSDLPVKWLRQLGSGVPPEQLLDITISVVPNDTKQAITLDKTSGEALRKLVERYQNRPLIDPHFSENDLYDEAGLPI